MFRPRFWPKIWCKTIYCFGRNKTFRPKEAVSAEIDCFGRKKCFGQNFGFGRNFDFSREPCFRFGVSAKNLFRLTTSDQMPHPPCTLRSLPKSLHVVKDEPRERDDHEDDERDGDEQHRGPLLELEGVATDRVGEVEVPVLLFSDVVIFHGYNLQSFPSHRLWDFVIFCFGSSPALLGQ